jgi:DNA-binding NarL/FixJ family response regulator
MKMMIVDDNSRMRDNLKNLLQRQIAGIETIYECSDGGEAIELYESTRPDWIFMDVAMQQVNGLTATKTITQSHPEAKIIIVTQYDDPEYREAAKNCGACAYVLKENLLDIPGIVKSVL